MEFSSGGRRTVFRKPESFCLLKEGKSEGWEVSEADRRIPDGRAESHAERVAGKDTAHFDIQSVLADTDETVFVIILSVQKLFNEFNAGPVLVPCDPFPVP